MDIVELYKTVYTAKTAAAISNMIIGAYGDSHYGNEQRVANRLSDGLKGLPFDALSFVSTAPAMAALAEDRPSKKLKALAALGVLGALTGETYSGIQAWKDAKNRRSLWKKLLKD